MGKKAIIIGGGPAGLTAAYELLSRTDITPIVLEMTGDIGGISKTVNYKGNRMDIGGHRFFSKSDRVMAFWLDILPQGDETNENVMLLRNRLSRILFMRKFFDYPVTLSKKTIQNLGLFRVLKIGVSYIWVMLFKRKEESLEDFFINRFGVELYRTFFRDYTEKVWGVPCHKIKPEWGAQRVKGLSIKKTIKHALHQAFFKKEKSIAQKDVETSLIDRFLYPKYGPGQLWEEVAGRIENMGGQILLHNRCTHLHMKNGSVTAVDVENVNTGEIMQLEADVFFSTMPIKELIGGMKDTVPQKVQEVAEGLVYRDFRTVGLLLSKFKLQDGNKPILDNWIYVQEPDVKVGRLQLFHNWSPYMVKDPNTFFVGMEYFCTEGDELWEMADEDFCQFAIHEMEKLGMIDGADVQDYTTAKMPKAYPAYFGTYDELDTVIQYVNQIDNLYLIGRNGMHRYNNTDHSMLTAMVAVDNIVNGITNKSNIWDVNAEQEYHEKKSSA